MPFYIVTKNKKLILLHHLCKKIMIFALQMNFAKNLYRFIWEIIKIIKKAGNKNKYLILTFNGANDGDVMVLLTFYGVNNGDAMLLLTFNGVHGGDAMV